MKDGLNLGAILTDRETGTVFINYITCAHVTSVNCTSATVHMINSTDEGATWNQPVNMSAEFGIYDFAGGPGYGIQVIKKINQKNSLVWEETTREKRVNREKVGNCFTLSCPPREGVYSDLVWMG